MNDIVPMNEPVTSSDAGRAQAEVPTESPAECPRTPSSSHPAPDAFAARLAMLDRVALLIGWGLPLLGLMGGTRILLESTDHGASFPGGWLAGLLGAICMMGTTVLAGLGASSVLRVLVQWLSLHRQPPEAESQSILGSLAERIDQLSERLAEPRSPSVPLPPALAATSTNWLREQSLAEIRRTIRAGKWDEAAALLDGYSPAELDDPRLSALRQEIQSAQAAARVRATGPAQCGAPGKRSRPSARAPSVSASPARRRNPRLTRGRPVPMVSAVDSQPLTDR